jgi:hypothetical protein
VPAGVPVFPTPGQHPPHGSTPPATLGTEDGQTGGGGDPTPVAAQAAMMVDSVANPVPVQIFFMARPSVPMYLQSPS